MYKIASITFLTFFLYSNVPGYDHNITIPEKDIVVTFKKVENKIMSETQCLAMNIYHEARGEDEIGQKAVASVVFNRIKSGKFPKTICGNVFLKSSRFCAFSWTCDDKSNEIKDKKTFASIEKLAHTMYDNFKKRKNYDYVMGSTHYHHFGVSPAWSNEFEPTISIGPHNFYKMKKQT